MCICICFFSFYCDKVSSFTTCNVLLTLMSHSSHLLYDIKKVVRKITYISQSLLVLLSCISTLYLRREKKPSERTHICMYVGWYLVTLNKNVKIYKYHQDIILDLRDSVQGVLFYSTIYFSWIIFQPSVNNFEWIASFEFCSATDFFLLRSMPTAYIKTMLVS